MEENIYNDRITKWQNDKTLYHCVITNFVISYRLPPPQPPQPPHENQPPPPHPQNPLDELHPHELLGAMTLDFILLVIDENAAALSNDPL